MRALERAGLTPPSPAWTELAVLYLGWVDTYAESHDLTAIRDRDRRVEVFLLQPLRLVQGLRPLGLEARTGIDIGTGAGVPSIGMILGGWRGPFWLVERAVKKADLLERFLTDLKPVLQRHGLATDVRVIPQDVRTVQLPEASWCVSQGVNWLENPLRRWVEKRIRDGVPMVWVTTPRRESIRLGGRPPTHSISLSPYYMVLIWL
ncbi:MAG: class I SAM-dependent methyltransferase [Acidobacteria bacterium]|nr:class I SAM-dependent methyltransferase [Acidobacteriota bacterium]MDW7984913.1 RsmG family class I SAM-dependent methyltransferase [Acidobacteriota bacterium]